MFIRGELTKEQELNRKAKTLEGKTTKDKFERLLQKLNDVLKSIQALKPTLSKNSVQQLGSSIQSLNDNRMTTSDIKKLHELIECHEDAQILLEDMKLSRNVASYDARLMNILEFANSFSTVTYSSRITFYEDKASNLQLMLSEVLKALQYRSSKLQFQINQTRDEILHLENQAVEKVKELELLSKQSYAYKDTSLQVIDIDKRIEMLKNTSNLLRKTFESIQFLAQLFEQLLLLDDYVKVLREDSETISLIKKLYRNIENIDVLESMLNLTEIIEKLKEEILEVNSLVKPAQRLIFDNTEEEIDESVLAKYQGMSNDKVDK